MYITRLILASAIMTVSIAVGCSDGADGGKRASVYKVSGKVTMAGGTIPGATIAFGPKEGQPVAIGRTNDSGEYQLTTYDPGDGAAKGLYAVTVSKFASSGAAPAVDAAHSPDSRGTPALSHDVAVAGGADQGDLIPGQYSDSSKTPLTFKVEEKVNVYDIEIK